jgi:hypothetical protein
LCPNTLFESAMVCACSCMKVFLLTALKAHSHSYALTIKMLVPTYRSTTRFLFCSSVVVFAKGIVGYPYYPSSPHHSCHLTRSSGCITVELQTVGILPAVTTLICWYTQQPVVTAFAVRTCLSHSIRSAHVGHYSAPSFQPCCYFSGAGGLSLRRQCTCSKAVDAILCRAADPLLSSR